MQFMVPLYHCEEDANGVKYELTRIPEFVKKHPEDAYRSAYYSQEADSSALYGPMTVTFAIRRAKDLLVEGCEYAGLQIVLESGGRRISQIPGLDELEKLFSGEDCLITINDRQFKPSTEYYGFQQVYNDSVKCIEALRNLGIPHEAIMVFATPEEISLEIHGGILGLEGRKDLAEQYFRLLTKICDIKEVDGHLQKNAIKTVLLNSCDNGRILLPGSTLPKLHRARVNVGASHFAYGPAAFSDFCSKKRTIDECLQESLNWVKFIETPLPAIQGLAEKIQLMPLLTAAAKPASVVSAGSTSPRAQGQSFNGPFRPLKVEIEASAAQFSKTPLRTAAFSSALSKAAGGWAVGSLNIITGSIDSGKGAFLLEQALLSQETMPVLYISFEETMRDFVLKAVARKNIISHSDLLVQTANGGIAGEKALKVLTATSSRLSQTLSESFYFAGCESVENGFTVDDIIQRALMLPDSPNRLVLLESVPYQALTDNSCQGLKQLQTAARKHNLTIIASVEREIELTKRPHFLDEPDRAILSVYKPFCDTVMTTHSERSNLRRFVSLLKGQVDPQAVSILEQKSLQLSGGKRLKSDTYNFVRLLHSKNGRRELILYLYQPDYLRLLETASIKVSLP